MNYPNNSLPEYNGSNQSFTFILIVADQIFQFVGVYNNMETAHLGQPELSVVHTGEADLLPGSGAVGLPGTVHGSLNSSYNKISFYETLRLRTKKWPRYSSFKYGIGDKRSLF